MCFNRNEPVRGEVQREDDISVMVHDIENPGEEEPVPEAIGRTLNEVTDAQLEDEMHIVTQMCILELASMIRFPNCTKCNGALNIDRKKKGTAVVLIWVSKPFSNTDICLAFNIIGNFNTKLFFPYCQ